MTRVFLIIQARMGSTRLPGKILLPVLDTTMLGHQLNRLRCCIEPDHLIVATPMGTEESPILDECHRGVETYQGSEGDVLSRYCEAYLLHGRRVRKGDVIVRITSDCPCADPELIDEYIRWFKRDHRERGTTYASNTMQRSLPKGLDVELFTGQALYDRYMETRSYEPRPASYELEHVTPMIRDLAIAGSTRLNYIHEPDTSDLRATLDTPEDYEQLKVMIETLRTGYNYLDVIDYLSR